jgi:hypothetical protein
VTQTQPRSLLYDARFRSYWFGQTISQLGDRFVTGVGVMLFDVNLNSLQACVTPDELRSRVSGAFSTVNYGVRPLGA